MTSEIRTNSFKSRAGLSTVTLTDSGPMFSGITTFVDNSTFSVGTGGTIHAPSTNTLNIGVNNTESLRIDSNSNLKVAGIVTATHFHGDGSNLTGITQTTINNNANYRLITGDANANELNAEPNLTFDGSTLGITGAATLGNGSGLNWGDTSARIRGESGSSGLLRFDTNGGERLRITSGGKLLLGAGAITTPKVTQSGSLDLDSGGISLCIGGNENSSGRTNSTNKLNRIVTPHYANAEEPMAMFSGYSSQNASELFYGGGSSSTNAATRHSFYTATNSTTTTGTERIRMVSNGQIIFGEANTSPVSDLEIRRANSGGDVSLRIGNNSGTNSGTTASLYFTTSPSQTFNTSYIQAVRDGGKLNFGYATNTPIVTMHVSQGKVGINEQSPDYMLHLSGSVPAICFEDTDGTHGQAIIEQNGDNLKIRQDAGNASSGTGSNIRFEVDGSEKMRLHSTGALSVGTSPSQTYWSGATAAFFETTAQNTVTISHSGGGNNYPLTIRNNRVNAGTGGYMLIFFGASAILQGSIISNNGSTSYNSGSDYRLKENIVDISDGITRVKQLQPRRFNWISDSNKTVQDGFIAHELQSVVPEATTGTKDEIVNQEGIDNGLYHAGAKVGDAVYQSVDYGKMTPLLTAALKELITKVETLEQENIALRARVTNLEGN